MKLKRLLSVLLTVLLLLSSVPAMAAKVTNGSATDSYCPSDRSGNHTHFWLDWEVTKQATCRFPLPQVQGLRHEADPDHQKAGAQLGRLADHSPCHRLFCGHPFPQLHQVRSL